ncbi:MAG TPA: menaquinone biosynthesis protein [Dongiaceae bacterium]|nr:menaquinone biosynthesis protein [Dongiaceae bacterium]
MLPLRLVTVPYVNAAPLLWGFRRGSLRDRCAVIAEPPSRIPDLLLRGGVDAGLVPIVAAPALAAAGITLLPSPGVASRERARSVFLASRRPLEEARSVALDRSSRTSQALARIVLAARGARGLRFTEAPPSLPEMLRDHDAALLIGDAALGADTRGLVVLDLAEAWRAMTGLPFVFAAWAVRPERAAETGPLFEVSLAEGLEHLDTIAAESAATIGIPAASVGSYLRDNIHYRFGEEEARAAALFIARARELGLVPTTPAPRGAGPRPAEAVPGRMP